MISYHLPGFELGCFGLFMFDKGINVAFKACFLFSSFMVIYFAGARQNLLGFVLIAVL